ncbi:MarR family winged helix-turn-helix transcriptional regulator [Amphritea sp.]|uniref:MarR family winged helix-turn-helix transcriptional regulator n=1 Tax=Amphritea sp. TaxID=1872502 RepID=UPI003A8F9D3F
MDNSSLNYLKLQQLIAFKLTTLANTITRAVSIELEKDFSIGITDHRILAVIAQNTTVSISEITNLTKIDKGWISRSVNSLLEQGMITKMPDQKDARRVKLALTDKGRELQQQLYTQSVRRHELLLEKFTPGETAMLFELVEQLQGQSDILLKEAEEK